MQLRGFKAPIHWFGTANKRTYDGEAWAYVQAQAKGSRNQVYMVFELPVTLGEI